MMVKNMGQEQISSSYDHLIGGRYEEPASGEYSATEDPSSGVEISRVAEGTQKDVNRAVKTAKKSFETWRNTDPAERGKLMYNVGQLIRENLDRIAYIESKDQGKPLSQARKDIEGAAYYFEYYAGVADKLEGKSIPVGTGKVDYTVREPFGVSAQIIPWNLPGNLYARGVAPALVAGNTVVIKPAPTTPLSAFILTELCHEAGIPGPVVNVVSGGGETGAALTGHKNVDCITFTGSVPTGQQVMESAAHNVTSITLELGGKNPAIVYPDANLETAADAIETGIFTNSGQVCSAADRVLVHESVHDDLVERLVNIVEQYELGPGVEDPDMGPVNSKEHLEKISNYIDLARSEGANVAAGGNVPEGSGHYVEPTIFTDVENNMRVAQEEIFGPVLTVIPFNDNDDELALANDVEYGLTAGVFTTDINRAMHATEKLRAGSVYINQWFGDTNQTPFGGFGKSGIGREKGLEALDSYLQTKNVAIKIDNKNINS